MKWRYLSVGICVAAFVLTGKAQSIVKLDLKRTIELANDSSLAAFRYQNMYLSGYWAYRTYKANRLPSLTMNLMPAQYYRYITQRYDSNKDMDNVTCIEVNVEVGVVLRLTHRVGLYDVELEAEDASLILIHRKNRKDGEYHHSNGKGNEDPGQNLRHNIQNLFYLIIHLCLSLQF